MTFLATPFDFQPTPGGAATPMFKNTDIDNTVVLCYISFTIYVYKTSTEKEIVDPELDFFLFFPTPWNRQRYLKNDSIK